MATHSRRSPVLCHAHLTALLRDVLPPPRESDRNVTLQAVSVSAERTPPPAAIRDEDLVGKLVRHTEVPDDPARRGERENAKRKLEQYLAKNPGVAPLIPAYRAKLRRR